MEAHNKRTHASFRPGAAFWPKILSRGTSAGSVVQRDVSRYYFAIDKAVSLIRNKFTEEEIIVLVQLVASQVWDESDADLLWAKVSQYTKDRERSGEPTEAGRTLARKIQSLSFFEKLALVDAMERFLNMEGADYHERAIALGLL